MTKRYNATIDLGADLGAFVDSKLETGRYGTTTEMIRAGLRLLQMEEAKLEALRVALIEGEESGDPKKFKAGALSELIKGDFE